MSDEFDDVLDNPGRRHGAIAPKPDGAPVRPLVARLVARVYAAAGVPLRARMLACLVRPLGALGLVAVASGAFADLLHVSGERDPGVRLDDLGRYSFDQIFELAQFVEQVSPDAIQQLAGVLADGQIGVAAFSAAAIMLLVRAVKGSEPKSPEPNPDRLRVDDPARRSARTTGA